MTEPPSEAPDAVAATPELTVQVLSWNTQRLTSEALDALDRDAPSFAREVLVLDNGSEDGTLDMLRARSGLRVLRSEENLGYARGHNLLAREARGDFLCLLGSDTRVRPGTLDALVRFLLDHEDYGAAAPCLVDVRGVALRGDDVRGDEVSGGADRVQTACMRFPTLRTALVYDMFWRTWPLLRRFDAAYHYRDFDHLHDQDVEQPPGTCLVLRRSLFAELGGFDEELWLFFNDVDLCKRIHDRGLRIRYLSHVSVEHHEGASTKAFGRRLVYWVQNRVAYYRKHHGRLGAGFVRLMTRLRAWQEWVAIGRRLDRKEDRRSARAEVKRIVREALSAGLSSKSTGSST
ncbi:MAG TPA: glycosyltransferase family 2 protein [Planctomycetota bacterium]|nr:glycosyltransferase family 2 protein [Planctomycetota bacterium]